MRVYHLSRARGLPSTLAGNWQNYLVNMQYSFISLKIKPAVALQEMRHVFPQGKPDETGLRDTL